jgi:hypothetical protein
MVQTRRQSQLGDGEGVKRALDSEPTEHTSTPNKGAIGGTDNVAAVPRKRRKIAATKDSVGLSRAVVEIGDTITVLPGLPVRSKDSGETADSHTTVTASATSRAKESQETKAGSGEHSKPTHTRFTDEEPEEQTVIAAVAPPEKPPRPAVQSEGDDESEDDAPEAVTLLSGQDQAKSREEEAAKALERFPPLSIHHRNSMST